MLQLGCTVGHVDNLLSTNVAVLDCGGSTNATGYQSGSGTAVDPYVICSAQQLTLLMNSPRDWGSSFRLMNDIDMALASGAQPIGYYDIANASTAVPFTGTFNGNGFTIRNLTLDQGGSTYTLASGLFAYLQNATVMNLNTVNEKVVGANSVALLAGRAVDSTVTAVSVSGEIDFPAAVASGQISGGLIGILTVDDGATRIFAGCNVNAKITAYDTSAGLIGSMTLTNSSVVNFSTANVQVQFLPMASQGNTFGGLFGIARSQSSSALSVSVAQVSMTAEVDLGGGTFMGGAAGTMLASGGAATFDKVQVKATITTPASFNAGMTGGFFGNSSASAAGGSLVVTRSSASGAITILPSTATARADIGGFVGNAGVSSPGVHKIQDCFSNMIISVLSSGVKFSGGFIGEMDTAGIAIDRIYVAGAFTAVSPGIDNGAIMGYAGGAATVSSNLYYDDTRFTKAIGSGTAPASYVGLTTAQMMNSTNYIGWDFTNTWSIPTVLAYPALQ